MAYNRKVNAGAPLPVIVRSLAGNEWGALRGRKNGTVRHALEKLADVAHPLSGELTTTAYQVAGMLGVHPRTGQRVIARLRDLGILVMVSRGGRQGDDAAPSQYVIVKAALVALLEEAAEDAGDRLREYIARAVERTRSLLPRPNTASRRTFSPYGGARPARQVRGSRSGALVRSHELPECEHGTPGGLTHSLCSFCRHASRTAEAPPVEAPAPVERGEGYRAFLEMRRGLGHRAAVTA